MVNQHLLPPEIVEFSTQSYKFRETRYDSELALVSNRRSVMMILINDVILETKIITSITEPDKIRKYHDKATRIVMNCIRRRPFEDRLCKKYALHFAFVTIVHVGFIKRFVNTFSKCA